MPERRNESRPDAPDRRSFPRPPLWLNLLVLLLGIGGLLWARYHKEQVNTRFGHVLVQQQRTPADVQKMKEELAEMDLTKEALSTELNGRMKFVQALKSEDFYLSVDSKSKKLRFYYGDTVLREADITVGEQASIKTPDGKTWTFIPVKGAFKIEGKMVDYVWRIPNWVYAMNKQPIPAEQQAIAGGLGKYVLLFPNGYVIHTPPSEDSPLKGAKPGSIMVPEADLAAIWERIHIDKTQVYFF
ncbi:MAG: L,D-transpeptidase [Thermoanaerobaculia bacterium]|nr:L,D-transpeptidase [Thermoanaerobaculia bacterium]